MDHNANHHTLDVFFDQDHNHLYRDDEYDDEALQHWFESSNLQFFKLLDMNRVLPLKHINQDNSFSDLGFPYFDPIDEYLSLWDDGDLPLLSNNDGNNVESNIVTTGGGDEGGRSGWRKTRPLELEEIEKHFEMPITMAARKMNVGLTMLKKRCRELNIKRWPHRKLKSIKSLMQNVKEMGLNEEMEMLEEQKRMITKVPEMELTKRTIKLRQACFKATYKKRRLDCPSMSSNQS
ncbi:hypothetical protein QVD17_08082 [Tagetes erecta]|uniref:RWP-RK domain-containing protein n=1 Tax=Tagetes erecta TaxID=13708 RepID=A0AAD8L451_TARER|nr:hypothetical protein QVD17_08082 [Tagetes erecta]